MTKTTENKTETVFNSPEVAAQRLLTSILEAQAKYLSVHFEGLAIGNWGYALRFVQEILKAFGESGSQIGEPDDYPLSELAKEFVKLNIPKQIWRIFDLRHFFEEHVQIHGEIKPFMRVKRVKNHVFEEPFFMNSLKSFTKPCEIKNRTVIDNPLSKIYRATLSDTKFLCATDTRLAVFSSVPKERASMVAPEDDFYSPKFLKMAEDAFRNTEENGEIIDVQELANLSFSINTAKKRLVRYDYDFWCLREKKSGQFFESERVFRLCEFFLQQGIRYASMATHKTEKHSGILQLVGEAYDGKTPYIQIGLLSFLSSTENYTEF